MIGVGAKLEYESGSTFVEIPDVRTVNFPAFNVTAVDNTSLANVDYGMTNEPGMIDPDVISFECIYSGDLYANVLMPLLREVIGWRVSDPAGGSAKVVTCDGFIMSLNVSISPNDLMVLQGQ